MFFFNTDVTLIYHQSLSSSKEASAPAVAKNNVLLNFGYLSNFGRSSKRSAHLFLKVEKNYRMTKGYLKRGPRCDTWMLVTKNGCISNSPNSVGVSSIKFIVVNLKGKFTQHRPSKYEQEELEKCKINSDGLILKTHSQLQLRQRVVLLGPPSLFNASKSVSLTFEQLNMK